MSRVIYKMNHIDASKEILDDLDYLLLSSGSDSRAYEILSKCNSGAQNNSIIFNFQERLNNISLSDSIYDYKQYRILKEINCEIRNPSSCLDELVTIPFTKSTKIGIDISCFTKPYFYFLIKLLKERFSVENIFVFYTEPKSYIFNKGLFNSFHSSSGPISVREMFGFSGIESRGVKRKLVILLGFDGDLSKEINEDVSPNDTIIVNGFPSYTPKCKDISLIANEKLVNDRNITIEYTRANNPFETYNLLQSIKNREDNVFINIAPLGPKPMALGACLFAIHNPDVRIVYPLPENYENKYSDSCWNSWVYEFSLSTN